MNAAELQRAFVSLQRWAKVGSAVCVIATAARFYHGFGALTGVVSRWLGPALQAATVALLPMLLLWGVCMVGSSGRFGRWMAALSAGLVLVIVGAVSLSVIGSALPPPIFSSLTGLLAGGGVLLGLNLLLARIFIRPAINRRIAAGQWIAAVTVTPPIAGGAVQFMATNLGLWSFSDTVFVFLEATVLWTGVMGIVGAIVLPVLARGTSETYDTTAFQLEPVPAELARFAHLTAPCPGCGQEGAWTAGVPCTCAGCGETVAHEIGHYRCACGYSLRGVWAGVCTECGEHVGGPITGLPCPWCRGETVHHEGRCACPACSVALVSRVLKRVRIAPKWR